MCYLESLKQLLREYVEVSADIRPETTFDELHLDSYAIVDFLMKAEAYYDITIPENQMLEMHCLQDVMDSIVQTDREGVKC